MPKKSVQPYFVGIAGGSGSGKTTVAKNLISLIDSKNTELISHDSYYLDLAHLSLAERKQVNFDHPDSLETELLIQDLMQLKNGQSIFVPIYDFVNYNRTVQTIEVKPAQLIIVEGILVFSNPTLRSLFDMKVFVDTPDDIRFIRRMLRDIRERGRSIDDEVAQYTTQTKPMYDTFVEPSKQYADVIVPEGGFNSVAVEMLTGALRNRLAI
jgi:uridine kinase